MWQPRFVGFNIEKKNKHENRTSMQTFGPPFVTKAENVAHHLEQVWQV